MGDRSVRVTGYVAASKSFGDSDDGEDDLDVIEMTPRRKSPASSKRAGPFSIFSEELETQVEGPKSSSRPPKGPVNRRVEPLRHLNEVEPILGSPAKYVHLFNGDPAAPSPGLARDPSTSSEVPSSRPRHRQSGFLGGFMSGLAKALTSVDNTVDSSPDNSPTSDGIRSPSRTALVVPQLRQELKSGENDSLRTKPLFLGAEDPEAKQFAKFLQEDGNSARIPVLCMCDFGDGDYARDLWVFPHNAMKRELFDLYEIVGVIKIRYLSLTWSDMYALRQWWRMFQYFWDLYLSIETSLLDPLIQNVLEIDGRRDQLRQKLAPLEGDREWLCLKFEEVNSYVEEFEAIPRGRAVSLLCRTMDELGFRILRYFNVQERLLPPLVESYHGNSIKTEIEGKIMDLARATPLVDETIVHLIRWMEIGKERDAWTGSNLWWGERSTLARMYKRYSTSHGRLLDQFRQKLDKKAKRRK